MKLPRVPHTLRYSAHVCVVTAASVTSGCAVGPDYAPPQILTSAQYQRQSVVESRVAANEAEIEQWWDGFGDPMLARFVMLAQLQNLDLAKASARVVQARAMLSAANAALLPFGAASGQTARAYQSIETPLGQILNSKPGFDRYGGAHEANVGASWELDLFGGLRREREASLAEYRASEAGALATRLAITAQAADIYIVARGLQARLNIARQQVQTQQHLLSTIRLLLDKGLAAERDAWQIEGALAQARASVPVLENNLEVASNALDVLLGTQPGTHRAELAEPCAIPKAPKITSIGSPADLLRRRPDLIVAERKLAASNARIGVAIAEYYPKLSLSGLIGTASTAGGNLFTSESNQATGAFGLRWRLFDFGRINAQIAASKGREAEMLIAYQLAALHAAEDVENAFSALLGREQQTLELTQAVDDLGRARSASAAAYAQGVVSLVEVLQADESMLRASDAQAQAQTESARAAVAAFRALGGGWEPSQTVASR